MKKVVLLLICVSMIFFTGCGKSSDAVEKDNKDIESVADTEQTTDILTDTESDSNSSADEDNPLEYETSAADSMFAFSEETEDEKIQEDEDLSDRDLFADFIMGRRAAEVSQDFLPAINLTELSLAPGDKYTVSELEDLLRKDSFIADTTPKVSYAPLSIHDGSLYALQLSYDTKLEPIDETMIFSEHDGELKIVFAIDSWSRRSAFINEEGIVFDSGSNGAGSHCDTTFAPDASFVYKVVSDLDEEYYGYHFCDENGESVEPLNTIMDEAGAQNEKAASVAYYREIIDGKTFYYFLRGLEKLTQDTVDYIDAIASSYNFTFDGKSAADEARSAYERKLGVEEACQNQTEPHWKTIQ